MKCKKCDIKIPKYSLICPECGNSNYELEGKFLYCCNSSNNELKAQGEECIQLDADPTFVTNSEAGTEMGAELTEEEQKKRDTPCLLNPWDDSYELGIETIDNHHKHIVILINKIFHSIKSRRRNETLIKEIVLKLNAYATEHFTYEEKLFLACNYPELKSHQAGHKYFIGKIDKLTIDFQKGIFDAREAMKFLMDWFIRHTQTLDKDFVLFLEDQKKGDR